MIFNERLDNLERRVSEIESRFSVSAATFSLGDNTIDVALSFARPIKMETAIKEFQWSLFKRILEEEKGVVVRATKKLGISRYTGYRLMKRDKETHESARN